MPVDQSESLHSKIYNNRLWVNYAAQTRTALTAHGWATNLTTGTPLTYTLSASQPRNFLLPLLHSTSTLLCFLYSSSHSSRSLSLPQQMPECQSAASSRPLPDARVSAASSSLSQMPECQPPPLGLSPPNSVTYATTPSFLLCHYCLPHPLLISKSTSPPPLTPCPHARCPSSF